MGTLLGIMNSKAAALDTFLKSLQDREINVEDVARIKKLSDGLEVKYANIESTWESLVEPGEDPFKDEKEYNKCKGDYEKASVTLDKYLEAAEAGSRVFKKRICVIYHCNFKCAYSLF